MLTLTVDAASPRSALALASRSAFMSHSDTLAPDLTSREAMAKPMPCAPPVITATWPLRSIWFIVLHLLRNWSRQRRPENGRDVRVGTNRRVAIEEACREPLRVRHIFW